MPWMIKRHGLEVSPNILRGIVVFDFHCDIRRISVIIVSDVVQVLE